MGVGPEPQDEPSSRWTTLRRIVEWAAQSYIIIIILGIVIGLQIAPMVTDFADEPEPGKIVVITIEGGIDGQNAASVVQRLRAARADSSTKAVVLRINSGGGSASASETLYLAVKETAKEMPVVVSVGSMAASGAYHAAVGGDVIFVKPASLVGSVGVIFTVPTDIAPLGELVTTGPNKITGADQRDWYYKMESLKRAFIGAVIEGRGDRLQLTASEVAYAKLYTGTEAVENGMADRIGSIEDAVARAASLAEVNRYTVETKSYEDTVRFISRTNYVNSAAPKKELVSPTYFVGVPGDAVLPNFVMLPPSVIRSAIATEQMNTRMVVSNATV